MRHLRRLAILWRPLRFASTFAIFVGAVTSVGAPKAGVVAIGLGLLGLLLTRVLFRMRWPRFDVYVAAYAPFSQPRSWRIVEPDTSGERAVWLATAPGVRTWVEGRQSKGHRILAQALGRGTVGMSRTHTEIGTLPGQSGRSLLAEMSHDSVADFTPVSADLASRFTPNELFTARSTGALPDWYWHELASQYCSDH